MEDLEVLYNWQETVVRNLRGYESTGHGDTIHKLRSYIGIIISARSNLDYYVRTGNKEKKAEMLEMYCRYMNDASKWMESIAKNIK